MLLYTARSEISTLLPNACDAFWTDMSRVFSDNVPQPAGVGAMQIAQDALGLNAQDAANLVSAAGATNVSSTDLTQLRARGGIAPNPRGTGAVRLPLPSNVPTNLPVLGGDPSRSFFLIQNNNGAGGANLLVSVDGPVNTGSPWAYLNFPPGQGLLLDEEIWTNPIYVAWGTGTVTGGVIFYGSGNPPPVESGMMATRPGRYLQ